MSIMFSKSIRFLVVATALVLISVSAFAHPLPAKAGFTSFPAGEAGIYITFPVAWPAGTQYVVSAQETNAGGFTPGSDCTYFNVLKLTDTNFQIQHKRCKDGTPVALTTNVTIGWIAVPVQ
jgi:hypothetical protein